MFEKGRDLNYRDNITITIITIITMIRLRTFGSMRRKSRRKGYPKIGVLGCMAERLKERLLEDQAVDLVCGPDAYR